MQDVAAEGLDCIFVSPPVSFDSSNGEGTFEKPSGETSVSDSSERSSLPLRLQALGEVNNSLDSVLRLANDPNLFEKICAANDLSARSLGFGMIALAYIRLFDEVEAAYFEDESRDGANI